jgi:hypothetical protein
MAFPSALHRVRLSEEMTQRAGFSVAEEIAKTKAAVDATRLRLPGGRE